MPVQSPNNAVAAPAPLLYLGYLQLPAGRPVLFFESGFLVQDDIDPVKRGWYTFDLRDAILTPVNERVASALLSINDNDDLSASVHRALRDTFLYEALLGFVGQPVPPDASRIHFAVVDTRQLAATQNASFYLFRDAHLVRATDAACSPNWRTPQALQALGPLDQQGLPTQHAHANLLTGLTRFASNAAPIYLGYVQSGNQAPTLFFDTGFLVQAHRDPAAVGWYAYRNVHRYGANMARVFASGLNGLNAFTAMWPRLNEEITRQMVTQQTQRAQNQVPPRRRLPLCAGGHAPSGRRRPGQLLPVRRPVGLPRRPGFPGQLRRRPRGGRPRRAPRGGAHGARHRDPDLIGAPSAAAPSPPLHSRA